MNANTSRRTRQSSKAGFTLLEILLTSLLASVVLVSLWSLSNIYLKLFVTGKRMIDETQLARGLTQQFAKDISQVIQLPQDDSTANTLSSPATSIAMTQSVRPVRMPDQPALGTGRIRPTAERSGVENPGIDRPGVQRPAVERTLPAGRSQQVSPPPNSQTSPLIPAIGASVSQAMARQSERSMPRFGLFGTDQALRLIVLQTDPQTVREPKDLAEFLPQPGQMRPAIASELRTIEYTCTSSSTSSTGGRQRPAGLIRREWAWETWVSQKMTSLRSPDAAGSSDMLPDIYAEWSEEDMLALETQQGLNHVPQVVGLEFQYYDGETWETEWNSWERQKLPLLVEVLIQIDVAERDSNTDSDEGAANNEEELSSLSGDSSSGISSTRGTVYRRLIHLPFAVAPNDLSVHARDNPLAEISRPSPLPGTRRP